MTDSNGNALQALVSRAVRRVLAERQEAQGKRRVYVVFTDRFEGPGEAFLQEQPLGGRAVLIVPDEKAPILQDRIQGLCPDCPVIGYSLSADLPLEGSLTVYPATSRTFAAKAALGIADEFPVQWLERCLTAGSEVHLMLSGLPRFSGHEPPRYAEQILSYYRTLLEYGITIGSFPEEADEPEEEVSGPHCTVRGHIITAADIASCGSGAVVYIDAGAVVTAYARERAEARHIRFMTR